MTNPLIQIDDIVREMTQKEYEALLLEKSERKQMWVLEQCMEREVIHI